MVILYVYAIKKSHKCISYYFILNEMSLLYSITLCVVFGKPLKTKLICISPAYTHNDIPFHLLLRFEMFTENHGEIQAMQ